MLHNGHYVDLVILVFIANEDYTAASQVFTFTPDMTQFTALIPILDDDILERPESFSLRAELLSADAATVAVAPNTSVVTILDNDSK